MCSYLTRYQLLKLELVYQRRRSLQLSWFIKDGGHLHFHHFSSGSFNFSVLDWNFPLDIGNLYTLLRFFGWENTNRIKPCCYKGMSEVTV